MKPQSPLGLRPLLPRTARRLVLTCAFAAAQASAAVLHFDRATEADVPVMDAADIALGRWHGSDRLLRVRTIEGGAHLVTPATYPGPWLSTVYAPTASVLGEDLSAVGVVRFALDLRLDATPHHKPTGNALILLIGTGGDEPGQALRLNLKDNGALFFVGGGAETRVGEALVPGEWTRLEAEIDFDAKTVSIRVGDTPAVPGFPLSSGKPRNRFGRVEFKTDGAAAPYRPLSLDNLRLERVR